MKVRGSHAVFGALLILGACDGAVSSDDYVEDTAYERAPESERLERAQEYFAGATFENIGDTSMCTEDCSGHDAGVEWAQNNEVTDPNECGGNSQSFVEGCEAYAEAVQDRVENEE